MQQCTSCNTIYTADNVETCDACSHGDYSDYFKARPLVEFTKEELDLNDRSYQKCTSCGVYVKTNTHVILANNLCPICDKLTAPL